MALAVAAGACAGAPGQVDRAAAGRSLDAADLSPCRPKLALSGAKSGVRSAGHATIVFDPSGEVQIATVDGGPLVGTEAGRCVEAALRARRIPAFTGPALKVGRSFHLD